MFYRRDACCRECEANPPARVASTFRDIVRSSFRLFRWRVEPDHRTELQQLTSACWGCIWGVGGGSGCEEAEPIVSSAAKCGKLRRREIITRGYDEKPGDTGNQVFTVEGAQVCYRVLAV
jgi:hypothetical protein